MAAILGFVSAVIYGGSDFLGGLAARRLSSLLVTFVSFVVAVVLVSIAVAVSAPVWSTDAVTFGAIAGVSGTIGYWAFFAALALGPMSIISSGVAAIYAIIPAIFGIALGERLPVIGYIALVGVIVAAVMLTVTPQNGPGGRIRPRALVLGLIAGAGFGFYIVAIDRTPRESGLVPLFSELVIGVVLLGVLLVVRRIVSGPGELAGFRDGRGMRMAIASGATFAVANSLLIIALHIGDLSIVGVLNSLYPLGTVLLAMIILKERITWVQGVGIALALGASAVLTVVSS